MRLIDADALLNSGYPTIYHTEFGDEVINTEDIKNAPTVEYTFEEAFQKTVCENRLYCPARPQGETNAEIFKQTFGIYATELWSMKEADFLEWLNAEAKKNER